AIGGSDNHDAGLPPDVASSIGRPTTVVHADALSTPAILAGLRAGRVFIDLDASGDRLLDLTARSAKDQAVMGGVLRVKAGETVAFTATLVGGDLKGLQIVRDGAVVNTPVGPDGTFRLSVGKTASWVRLNLRDDKGRLMLIGNPIYLRPAG
ncbi:hypothetical protein PMI01_00503, partial [Caulobacter sp. AP07]